MNVAAFFEHDTCTAGSLNRVYTALGVSFHFALHETRRSKVLSFGMSVCETKKKERDERKSGIVKVFLLRRPMSRTRDAAGDCVRSEPRITRPRFHSPSMAGRTLPNEFTVGAASIVPRT